MSDVPPERRSGYSVSLRASHVDASVQEDQEVRGTIKPVRIEPQCHLKVLTAIESPDGLACINDRGGQFVADAVDGTEYASRSVIDVNESPVIECRTPVRTTDVQFSGQRRIVGYETTRSFTAPQPRSGTCDRRVIAVVVVEEEQSANDEGVNSAHTYQEQERETPDV